MSGTGPDWYDAGDSEEKAMPTTTVGRTNGTKVSARIICRDLNE